MGSNIMLQIKLLLPKEVLTVIRWFYIVCWLSVGTFKQCQFIANDLYGIEWRKHKCKNTIPILYCDITYWSSPTTGAKHCNFELTE
jgi:hypothetical protein